MDDQNPANQHPDFADAGQDPTSFPPPPAWTLAGPALPPPPPTSGPAAPAHLGGPRRGRRGFAAAVVAAALVVGGGAGLGGAAAYDALNGDDGGSAPSASGTSFSTVASTGSDADASAAVADGTVEKVAATVLPSVVKLDVSGAQGAGSGSGIILSSDGLILTNNHVAEIGAQGGSITVSFNDGSHASATVVGTDPLTDTALVQAQDVSGLTPATLGKSSQVQVGQGVVAVGSPFGLDATVTAGIVSALNRPVNVGSDGEGNATVYPAIQTDAAINPGNSGGPLVDLDGNVVGINSSIQSTSTTGGEAGSIGLGFAIPIEEVLPIIDQIKNGETPTHARLGISVEDVAAGHGALVSDGAVIREIGDGSAASSAGLRAGDVITKIDDTLITGSDSLVATVRAYRPGDEVTVTYTRDGEERTATITLDSDAETSNS
ncbi:S1C family serine protease [Nocardioides sp.]|uniref:S1C family serine protease n=1 Tax=Nocardioides sp. TaxID=35761 RepID=UPI00351581CA